MNSRDDIFRSHGFGKVAPWVDLVNSEEWDGFGNLSDWLNDPRWLASFLRHWKLRAPSGERIPLPRLKPLRRRLRRIAERLDAGGRLRATETGLLNAAMNVPVHQRLFQDQNGYATELIPIHANWDSILARIAASAAETLTSGKHARIKICANYDCNWVFYDPTKAHIKRWCSSKTCGNRDRVRRCRAASAR